MAFLLWPEKSEKGHGSEIYWCSHSYVSNKRGDVQCIFCSSLDYLYFLRIKIIFNVFTSRFSPECLLHSEYLRCAQARLSMTVTVTKWVWVPSSPAHPLPSPDPRIHLSTPDMTVNLSQRYLIAISSFIIASLLLFCHIQCRPSSNDPVYHFSILWLTLLFRKKTAKLFLTVKSLISLEIWVLPLPSSGGCRFLTSMVSGEYMIDAADRRHLH